MEDGMATTDGQGLYALQTVQYSTNLELLLQQMGSKLRPYVRTGSHTGKMASPVNHVGPVKMKAPAGRFAPLNRTDSDHSRRWVFPRDGELQQLIDTFDQLKTEVANPQSSYLRNAAAAYGRFCDDEIIYQATAVNYLGQDAASLAQETFNTSKFQVAVNFGASAASGLTVAKLIETRRILRKYENDLEMESPVLIAGSQQESDLLNQAQVVSKEFNDRPVLTDGKVTRMVGFNIVYMERLPIVTTNVRGCLAWVPSGVYLGMWKDMQHSVDKRTDLSGHPMQLYTMCSIGACRDQPGKLIQVLCADTTGASITP
jgi:hypothetical protein